MQTSNDTGSVNKTLSIIMPVLNEAQQLECRAANLRQVQRFAELRIVDGGSIDRSVALAEAIPAGVVRSAPGRAQQMNAGAETATADYLLFLHADTALPEDFSDFVTALEQERPGWGFFAVRLVPGGMGLSIVERCMNWRSSLTSVATGDQALFVRRELFQTMGGFAAIPLMEDIEMSKRLRQHAPPFIWRSPVQTSSRRWRQRGLLTTILLMWQLRLLYVLGVSPQRLHRRYYGKGTENNRYGK